MRKAGFMVGRFSEPTNIEQFGFISNKRMRGPSEKVPIRTERDIRRRIDVAQSMFLCSITLLNYNYSNKVLEIFVGQFL